jgi:hypothetical protein
MLRKTQNPLISSLILCPFAEQSSLAGTHPNTDSDCNVVKVQWSRELVRSTHLAFNIAYGLTERCLRVCKLFYSVRPYCSISIVAYAWKYMYLVCKVHLSKERRGQNCERRPLKGGRRNTYGGVVTTPTRTVVRTPTRTMVRTFTANYV